MATNHVSSEVSAHNMVIVDSKLKPNYNPTDSTDELLADGSKRGPRLRRQSSGKISKTTPNMAVAKSIPTVKAMGVRKSSHAASSHHRSSHALP